jgi:hypothetical protein
MGKFPADFVEYISNHTLIKIRGGSKPRSFLNIWIVNAGDRLFARSWDKSERSWYTAFITEGVGQIQYGEQIIDVSGIKIAATDPVHELINQAYLDKYTQEENVPYATGFTQKEYTEYTIEFKLLCSTD